jgi:hypothetical protein
VRTREGRGGGVVIRAREGKGRRRGDKNYRKRKGRRRGEEEREVVEGKRKEEEEWG